MAVSAHDGFHANSDRSIVMEWARTGDRNPRRHVALSARRGIRTTTFRRASDPIFLALPSTRPVRKIAPTPSHHFTIDAILQPLMRRGMHAGNFDRGATPYQLAGFDHGLSLLIIPDLRSPRTRPEAVAIGVCVLGLHKQCWAIAAIGLSLVLYNQSRAVALGGRSASVPPWHPHHIDQLPPEVRSTLFRMCGVAPSAMQYFVTYLNDSRLIKLDFERLHCDNQASFCREENCLRHEYTLAGGRYRLTKSYYRRKDD